MLVYELGFSHFGRQYRLDMALPDHFLGIELDGWEFHGKHLSSFARDREKSIWFERRGWRVIRFSARQVNQSIEDVCQAIEDIKNTCPVQNSKSWSVTQTSFDRSQFVKR
jgi:very-short-patch-repair endonuclease